MMWSLFTGRRCWFIGVLFIGLLLTTGTGAWPDRTLSAAESAAAPIQEPPASADLIRDVDNKVDSKTDSQQTEPADQNPIETLPKKPSLRERLDKSLGNRPAIASSNPTALARQVQQHMDQARDSVAAEDLSTAVRQQTETLQALDALLAGLNSGESPPESSEGASRTEQGGVTQTPSPSQGDGQRSSDNGSAMESNPDARPEMTADQVAAQRRRLATSVWGHLPDRVREQLKGNYREQFLPEYADLVEDYYRSLAEDATRQK